MTHHNNVHWIQPSHKMWRCFIPPTQPDRKVNGWMQGRKRETRPLCCPFLGCTDASNQIEAADLSHVICTQGVNSIINSRCRYYNSGYDGPGRAPLLGSAQLMLDSSDVGVDADAECRNIVLRYFSLCCQTWARCYRCPFLSPRRFVYPVKSQTGWRITGRFSLAKRFVTSAHQRSSCSVPLQCKSQTPTDTDLSTR
jgi:hypothetical protein